MPHDGSCLGLLALSTGQVALSTVQVALSTGQVALLIRNNHFIAYCLPSISSHQYQITCEIHFGLCILVIRQLDDLNVI